MEVKERFVWRAVIRKECQRPVSDPYTAILVNVSMQLRESSECLGQSCVGAFLSILRNDCSRVIGPHPALYKKGDGLAYIGRS